LQAGARLDDLDTAEPLAALASGNQAEYSQRATKLLGVLLKRHRTTPKLIEPLRELLDSNDTRVRLAAYDALAEINDASLRRFAFGDKLELAQVRCDKPMVYVARQGRPRVILFNDRIGFNKPLTFSMWDDRLMIRAAEGAKLVDVFHKRPGQRAETQQIPDNVPYLTGVMAFNPEIDSKSPGFDMTYAEIVTVLHKLVTQRHIDAPLVLQTSDLDARIAALRSEEMIREARPESGTEAPRPDHSKPKVQEKDGGLLGIFDTEPESKSSPPPQENPEKKKGFLGF